MQFIDIHSHILPGLDDGPESFEECIRSARFYENIGVEQVIATPHCIQGSKWAQDPAHVMRTVAQTQQKIREAGIPLQILPGMEIAVNDILNNRFTEADFLSLGETGVFLIEFPLNRQANTSLVPDMAKLLAAGGKTRYIIAHPERCPLFQDNISAIQTLIAEGMLVQVNIASVLGDYGKKVRETVLHLFRLGQVHFLATDSHGREGRMPPNSGEMQELENILGNETVDLGFRANPLRLLNGEEIFPLRTEPTQPHVSSAAGCLNRIRKIFTHNSLD